MLHFIDACVCVSSQHARPLIHPLSSSVLHVIEASRKSKGGGFSSLTFFAPIVHGNEEGVCTLFLGGKFDDAFIHHDMRGN